MPGKGALCGFQKSIFNISEKFFTNKDSLDKYLFCHVCVYTTNYICLVFLVKHPYYIKLLELLKPL